MQILALGPVSRGRRRRRADATFQLLNGLVGGLTGAVVEGVGNTAVTLKHTPRLVAESCRSSSGLRSVGVACGAALAAVLAPPVVLVGSTLAGFARGAREGTPEAISAAPRRVRGLDLMLQGGVPAVQKWVHAQLEAWNPRLRQAREVRELVEATRPSGSNVQETEGHILVGGTPLRRANR